jgi:hypothetical protein
MYELYINQHVFIILCIARFVSTHWISNQLTMYEAFGGEKDDWSYCMKPLGERRTIDLIVWSLWGREGRLILLYEAFGGEKDDWSYRMKPFGGGKDDWSYCIDWSYCMKSLGGEKDDWSYCMKSLGERRTIDLIVWSLWGRERRLLLLYEAFGGEKDD